MGLKGLVFATAALAAVAAPLWSRAQDQPEDASAASSANQPASNRIDLSHDAHSRMTVPVSIDGSGPYPFVVDTGAERTVISRELADQLDLDAGGSVIINSMSGAQQVGTVLVPHLRMNTKRVSSIEAPVLASGNIGALGMLGVDSLQSQSVLFDFVKGTMMLTPSRKRPVYHDPDEIVVTARSRYGRLMFTHAEADGTKVFVIIDTGSEITIGNEALRRRLLAGKRTDLLGTTELISVTGGKTIADVGTIHKLAFGGVNLVNLNVAFADVFPFRKLKLNDRPALLLGMNALKAFDRVSMDFANRKVRFLLPDRSQLLSETKMAALDTPPHR